MKNWYNGYTFGKVNVYNPWSCIKYIKDHLEDRDIYPAAYWVNTSSNSIVRELIDHANEDQREIIGRLIKGETITIPVHEDITYGDVYDNINNLWNFMFFTGHFKKIAESFDESEEQKYVTLQIVNREVTYIFKNKVNSWFDERVQAADRTMLFSSIISGNTNIFTEELTKLLRPIISYHDYSENYYHGFLIVVLSGMDGYLIRSNREAELGRSDIFIKPISRHDTAFVLELKVAYDIDELERKAREAIAQIIDKRYEDALRADGYKKIARYGIAFFKKDCLAISE